MSVLLLPHRRILRLAASAARVRIDTTPTITSENLSEVNNEQRISTGGARKHDISLVG
jgi:hypothetical protein